MPGFRIPQSVSYRAALKAYLSSDHISPATGKTIPIVISKNMGAFANPSAGATNAVEVSNGWYYVDLSTTDTGTKGPLIVRGNVATVDDVEIVYRVVDANTGDFTALSNIKKNQALAAFPFVMTDATTHAPKTGVTVTATRRLDSGAFGACANAPTEVGNGWYTIDLAAGDLNGNTVALRFTGAASDDQLVSIITQP